MPRKENTRGDCAPYADCIDDDDSVYDADDAVCDDGDDGLTPEEVEEYNNECNEMEKLRCSLIACMGFEGFRKWTRSCIRSLRCMQ